MDRRTFLKQAVSAPLFLGGEGLFAQDPSPGPLWLSDAYWWMKQDELRGIVVVVPDPAPDRAALGKALWQRINHGGAPVHALFLQSIFIFIREPQARQHLGKDLKPWDRLVLAPDGSLLLRGQVSLKIFQDQEKFESAMAPAVFGDDRAILADRDEKAWALAPPEIREALGQLRHGDILIQRAAVNLLRSRVARIVPSLIRRALEPNKTDESEAARELIEEHYRQRLSWSLELGAVDEARELRKIARRPPFQQLPYGVALPERVLGGCGITVEEPPEGEGMLHADQETIRRSSGMLCGMASMRSPSYSFVKFLVN